MMNKNSYKDNIMRDKFYAIYKEKSLEWEKEKIK